MYDLTDMFNNTSNYLDDIFTIDNLEFERHIPDIYQTELQLNKTIIQTKISLILIYKILVMMLIPSFTTNRMTSYRQFSLVEW